MILPRLFALHILLAGHRHTATLEPTSTFQTHEKFQTHIVVPSPQRSAGLQAPGQLGSLVEGPPDGSQSA